MAYMSQEKKAAITPAVKKALTKFGLKGRLGVRHHSTLVLKLTEGNIDFITNFNSRDTRFETRYLGDAPYMAKDYIDINPYHYDKHFSGKALQALTELMKAMNAGNHDRSDIQTDYFDIGWYVEINIGTYDKPYKVTK